ncbi:hypothetical protein THASP1DRAFT_33543, partial [Thamnocephalis sphaerospora]
MLPYGWIPVPSVPTVSAWIEQLCDMLPAITAALSLLILLFKGLRACFTSRAYLFRRPSSSHYSVMRTSSDHGDQQFSKMQSMSRTFSASSRDALVDAVERSTIYRRMADRRGLVADIIKLASSLVGFGGSLWHLIARLKGIALLFVQRWFWHSALASSIVWFYAIALSIACIWRRRLEHGPNLAKHQAYLFTVILVCAATTIGLKLAARTFIIQDQDAQHLLMVTASALLAVVGVLATRGSVQITSTGRVVTLEESASFIEQMLFDWLTPLVSIGSTRSLRDVDLWDLYSRDRAAVAVCHYEQKRHRSMLRSLFDMYRRDLITQAAYAILWSATMFLPPYFLECLLQSIENPKSATPTTVWFYVGSLFVSLIVSNTAFQQSERLGQHLSIRCRAIVSYEVSRKCMLRRGHDDEVEELPNQPLYSWDTDNVSALLNVDVQNIGELLVALPNVVGGPIQVCVALVMLWRVIGLATIFSLAIIGLMFLVSEHIVNKLSIAYEMLSDITEARLAAISELIRSIRAAKLFAWEEHFLARITAEREREMAANWNKLQLVTANIACMITGPLLTICISLGVYTTVFGHMLTASVAFTTVILLNMLRITLWRTPQVISWIRQANASSARIDHFLSAPVDISSSDIYGVDTFYDADVGRERILLENATFQWDSTGGTSINFDTSSFGNAGQTNFTLQGLNVEFFTGELNVIAGPPGSGKTSLLMALLGDMPLVQGYVHLPRRHRVYDEFGIPHSNVAYVAQSPWLRSATVRENILFGQPYEETRYRQVLHACALERDIGSLQAGDYTLIGERGVSIPEGLQQRVALARAIYSSARHLLMDDFLSAMDGHTAKHIVERCLFGPLAHGRTRILVTRRVD